MSSSLSKNRALDFYPAYCFPASPTYNQWVKLTTVEVQSLNAPPEYKGQNIYFYLNHPIRYVTLVGLLISISFYSKFISFEFDDFSGAVIELTAPLPTSNEWNMPNCYNQLHQPSVTANGIDLTPLKVGMLVKAKGTITASWEDHRRLSLLRCQPIRSTAIEISLWNSYVKFHEDVLRHPWTLSSSEQEKLLKIASAERNDEEEYEKKKAKWKARLRQREERRQRKLEAFYLQVGQAFDKDESQNALDGPKNPHKDNKLIKRALREEFDAIDEFYKKRDREERQRHRGKKDGQKPTTNPPFSPPASLSLPRRRKRNEGARR